MCGRCSRSSHSVFMSLNAAPAVALHAEADVGPAVGQREAPHVARQQVRLEPHDQPLGSRAGDVACVLPEGMPLTEVSGLADAERLARRRPHPVRRDHVPRLDRADARRRRPRPTTDLSECRRANGPATRRLRPRSASRPARRRVPDEASWPRRSRRRVTAGGPLDPTGTATKRRRPSSNSAPSSDAVRAARAPAGRASSGHRRSTCRGGTRPCRSPRPTCRHGPAPWLRPRLRARHPPPRRRQRLECAPRHARG